MWDLLATTENRLSVPNVTQSKKQEHHTFLCDVLRWWRQQNSKVRGVFLSAFSWFLMPSRPKGMNLETLGAQGFEETKSLKQLRHRGLRKDEQISDFSEVCRTFAGHWWDVYWTLQGRLFCCDQSNLQQVIPYNTVDLLQFLWPVLLIKIKINIQIIIQLLWQVNRHMG